MHLVIAHLLGLELSHTSYVKNRENSASPATIFGGTLEQIKDQFLLASGTKYAAGSMGGSADAVIPTHTHTITALSNSRLELKY